MAKNAKNGLTYEIPMKFSNTQRAAHFLDWHAKHHPGTFIAYNEILKAITGVGRTPQLKSQEVEHLRKGATSIRKRLYELYGREMIALPGVGVRASIGDGDVLQNVMPKKSVRLQAARASFVRTAAGIDTAKIPNTPEMAPLKAWFGHAIKDVMKQISSPEFERKLLPPGTGEAK